MEITFKQVYDNNVQNHILWYMFCFLKNWIKQLKSWDINCSWVIIEKLWDTFVTGTYSKRVLIELILPDRVNYMKQRSVVNDMLYKAKE